MDKSSNSPAQLGCGTLILIAIIVAIFSNVGAKEEIEELRERLIRIEAKLDRLPPLELEQPEN